MLHQQSVQNRKKSTFFSHHYLRNCSTSAIGTFDYITVNSPKHILPKYGIFLLKHPMYIHKTYKTKPDPSTDMGEGTATVKTITTGI
jgi:hypothetical protein